MIEILVDAGSWAICIRIRFSVNSNIIIFFIILWSFLFALKVKMGKNEWRSTWETSHSEAAISHTIKNPNKSTTTSERSIFDWFAWIYKIWCVKNLHTFQDTFQIGFSFFCFCAYWATKNTKSTTNTMKCKKSNNNKNYRILNNAHSIWKRKNSPMARKCEQLMKGSDNDGDGICCVVHKHKSHTTQRIRRLCLIDPFLLINCHTHTRTHTHARNHIMNRKIPHSRTYIHTPCIRNWMKLTLTTAHKQKVSRTHIKMGENKNKN